MATTQVSVSEYLHTAYRPDCDYVDGEVQERFVGELDHALLQRALLFLFAEKASSHGLEAIQELRLRVEKNRFRVPDVMVLRKEDFGEQVVTKAPVLCFEILSPEDRFGRRQERIDDYLRMGVEQVWVLNPATRKSYRCFAGAHDQWAECTEVQVQNPALKMSLQGIFSVLQ